MPSEVSSADGDREDGQRKRSSAFTPIEKAVLLRLVQAKKDILGSRQADFTTIKKKQQAWADIAADFSNHSGVSKRTPFQLKKFWNNSKRKTRIKESSRITRQRSSAPELHCEIHVNSVEPSQMKPIDNEFDCENDLKLENDNDHVEANNGAHVDMGDALQNVVTELSDSPDGRTASSNDKEDLMEESCKVTSKLRKDTRSSLVDMEYEEHKLRLKVLLVNYETELLKKQLAEEQLKMAKEEHLMKVQLIAAQMMRASGN